MSTIELNQVGKCYKGVWVLKDVTMSFEEGRIYGITGRNGTGKTLIMKMIAGLVVPTVGTIRVMHRQIGEDIDVPDSIGAVIEVPGFLPMISGLKNLQYLAGLRGRIKDKEIKEAMASVGLDPEDRKHTGKYSLGMRQRLGIAQAIMEDPDIILLDEPMNGLDADGVRDIKAILLGLRKRGKTILLASHHADDIRDLCDVVVNLPLKE